LYAEIGLSKAMKKHPRAFQPLRHLHDDILRNLKNTTEQEKFLKAISTN